MGTNTSTLTRMMPTPKLKITFRISAPDGSEPRATMFLANMPAKTPKTAMSTTNQNRAATVANTSPGLSVRGS